MEEAKKAAGHVLATKEFKASPKGQVTTREETSGMKAGKMTIEAGGKKMEGTTDRSESNVTTLASLGDSKARRTLESQSGKWTMTLNGQERPLPVEKDALEGVPVLFDYKDGKGVATLESGEAAKGEQVKALERLNKNINKNNDFEMYGDTPRKVGDKWTVDPQSLTSFGAAKKISGTYTLEFAEIKEFQGTPCAVLKSQFDIVLEGSADDEEGDAKMKMGFKGNSIVHRSLADQMDLEAKVSAVMTIDGEPQPGMTMHIEGDFTMTEKTTVKKP